MTFVHSRYAVCSAWLLATALGGWLVARYSHTPGQIGNTPERWPADSQVIRTSQSPTLIMFAHPQCPCTRASVAELNRLLTRCQGRLAATVLFVQPTSLPQEWTQTDLWRYASSIPGVTVGIDLDGVEANRFGAESSGQVVLYDGDGKLLFRGGITAARGQAGDNAGENVIASLVAGREVLLNQTPVFGCGLLDRSNFSSPPFQ